MGWRFRRSFRIIPGLRLNISKRGLSSLSIGGPGATLNVGRRGVRQTIGIPGTGLSYTTSSRGRGRSTSPIAVTHVEANAPPSIAPATLELARFKIVPDDIPLSKTAARIVLLYGGLAVFLLSLRAPSVATAVSLVAVLVGMLLPSRRRLEAKEQRRCQALARTELNQRLEEFRNAGDNVKWDGPSAHKLLELQQKLDLTDEDVGPLLIERLKGLAALSDYQTAVNTNNGQLPAIEGYETIVRPGVCYFAASATYDKRGDNDPTGTLYLSSERAIFFAEEGLTTADWDKVMSIECDDEVLKIQRRDRQTPYLFLLSSIGEALKARFIGQTILRVPAQAPRVVEAAPAAPRNPSGAHDGTRAIDLGTGHGFSVGIVGESYRQTALRTLAADKLQRGETVTFVARLTREPANPYDSNAIRVDVRDGDQLGYLSKTDAVAYHDVLEAVAGQNAIAICNAKLVGGTPTKPSIGVMLDLRAPADLLATIENTQPF